MFAVSNSSSGPWSYVGSDGTSNTYVTPTGPNVSKNLVSTSNGYALFSGYRYFRYRVYLGASSGNTQSPIVNDVVVNWSP